MLLPRVQHPVVTSSEDHPNPNFVSRYFIYKLDREVGIGTGVDGVDAVGAFRRLEFEELEEAQ